MYESHEIMILFVQTSIFMITDPHIGHLYTAFLADAAHRWQKLTMGSSTDKTILSTGTDEHGLKVQRAATESGMPTQSLCDQVSQRFRVRTIIYRFIFAVECFRKSCISKILQN